MSKQTKSNDNSSLFQNECRRFNNYIGKFVNKDRALGFLILRDQGCNIKKAVRYCGKQQCKHDSSIKKEGPCGFKILKSFTDSCYSHNGWVNAFNVRWDVGQEEYEVPILIIIIIIYIYMVYLYL